MQNDKYWRSKIPLPLVLLFILNLLLVMAVEILVIYRYPLEITAQTLEEMDPGYSGSQILSSESRSILCAALVKTESHRTDLVVTKRHSIFFSRVKLLSKQTVTVPTEGELPVYIKTGIHTSEVVIQPNHTVSIRYAAPQNSSTMYLLLPAVLTGLELALWALLRGNRQ